MRSPQAGEESLNSRSEEPALPSIQIGAAQEMVSARQRGRRSRRPDSYAGEIVDEPVTPAPEVEYDRFRASSLTPIGETPERRGKRLRDGGPRQETFRQKPLRFMDRALLVVEVMGALVVAWLAFQYVYTAYIDTGPRRVSPPRSGVIGGQLGRGVSQGTITTVPTRFVEVAPPLSGGPNGGTGSSETATATLTPTATVPVEMRLPSRLRIPVMSLDSPVHEVSINMGTWEVSPMDVGHHFGTGMPGEQGNVVLAGHRDINSALFRELDRLAPGDEIFVSNSLGEYRYIVSESLVVSPEHIEVMDPTDDSRVTLITCTPIGLATQRLVVTAVLDHVAVR